MSYYIATVERKFTLHAPTPQIVEEIKSAFIEQALNENPNGTQGDPEVLSTCLVTGQKFSMTLKIEVLDATKLHPPRNDQVESSGAEKVDAGSRSRKEGGRRSRSSGSGS